MILPTLALILTLGQNNDLSNLKDYMSTIAPHVGKSRILYVAKLIKEKSDKYGIDPFIFATIIKQESGFLEGVIACTHRSCDYGLAQINDINVQRYNLDRNKLVSDDRYSLEVAARMLSRIRKDYPGEINYYSRYHDNRPKQRAVYEVFLNKWMERSEIFNEVADDR